MTNPFRLFVLQAISAFISSESSLHGTSIAFVRTDMEIVIAADSRSTDSEGNKQPDACKIRNAGQMYFTIVGMTTWQGVDFEALAERSIQSTGTLDSRITSFVKEMMPLLDHVLESDLPARKIATKQGSIMSIVVYGKDAGTLVADVIKFGVTSDARHVLPRRRTCPGECPDGRLPVFAPEGVLDSSVPNLSAVWRFVQKEINKQKPDIGGPIQIMRIDRNGKSQWIRKPAVCKDQK